MTTPTPLHVWKKNKVRSDLRKYTRIFESKFKSNSWDKPKNMISEVGKIYAIFYRVNNSYPTDKHHVTPVIFSFGRFINEAGYATVRGLNLLYLSNHDAIIFLEKAHVFLSKKPDERVPGLLKLHAECLQKYPYAFKNLDERRILSINEVESLEWGMIPLLHKHLLGNFNARALESDFTEENKFVPTPVRKKKEKDQIKEIKEDTVSMEMTEGEIDFDLDDDI